MEPTLEQIERLLELEKKRVSPHLLLYGEWDEWNALRSLLPSLAQSWIAMRERIDELSYRLRTWDDVQAEQLSTERKRVIELCAEFIETNADYSEDAMRHAAAIRRLADKEPQ